MPSIVIYTKSWCPFCQMAKQMLTAKGQPFEEIDVDLERGREAEMVERSGSTSVPQIWIDERHIGGYDDLAALDAAGDLDRLL